MCAHARVGFEALPQDAKDLVHHCAASRSVDLQQRAHELTVRARPGHAGLGLGLGQGVWGSGSWSGSGSWCGGLGVWVWVWGAGSGCAGLGLGLGHGARICRSEPVWRA